VKRFILVALLGGLLATNSGCCLCQAIFCWHPCGMPRNNCAVGCGGDCDDGCGPTCGPPCRAVRPGCGLACARRCGDCDTCDGGCGSCVRPGCGGCGGCGDPCADPCGGGCCGRPWHRGPLSCVFAFLGEVFGCCGCGGCGERYWGDFYSDPPDFWDPCDCHGNYAGNGYVGGGYPGGNGYSAGGSSGGGCRHCNGGGGNRADDSGTIWEDNATVTGDRAGNQGQPSQSGQPHKATRPQQ
jgi:hypothetical protein